MLGAPSAALGKAALGKAARVAEGVVAAGVVSPFSCATQATVGPHLMGLFSGQTKSLRGKENRVLLGRSFYRRSAFVKTLCMIIECAEVNVQFSVAQMHSSVQHKAL